MLTMKNKLESLESAFTLANGNKIPCVGFGTWQSAEGEEAYNAVLSALRSGYRHIDTAAAYGNEKSVGKAVQDFINESGVKREELFITTKLWNLDHGYENTKRAIKTSLDNLSLDYVDLYLIHWPNPLKFRSCWQETNAGSWKAMEEAYKDGKLKAIGLSNFCERHIDELLKTAQIKPMANQIKICPGISQKNLADYSRSLGMVVEGYSPFGTGGIFNSEEMKGLAQKYGKTVAQICVRWSLQQNVVPLPKSVSEERIKENAQVFDFEISDEDCELISGLSNLEIRPVRNPDEAEF